jgi:hypothetical protein
MEINSIPPLPPTQAMCFSSYFFRKTKAVLTINLKTSKTYSFHEVWVAVMVEKLPGSELPPMLSKALREGLLDLSATTRVYNPRIVELTGCKEPFVILPNATLMG